MSVRCSKPGCGARAVIGAPCTDIDCPQDWPTKALLTAGYRLIPPGQLDRETIEKCAAVADSYSNARPGDVCEVQAGDWQAAIAAAIRALGAEK